MRASRLRQPATLLFGGQQIGVTREAPPPVALLAQDRERVAGARTGVPPGGDTVISM
jgi:hypothetical protein